MPAEERGNGRVWRMPEREMYAGRLFRAIVPVEWVPRHAEHDA